MLSLTLMLTPAEVTVNKAFAEPDLQNILQALQLQLHQQQQDEKDKQVKHRYRDQSHDDEDDDSRYGSLKPHEVQTLIQDALHDKEEALLQSQKEPYAYKKKRQQYNDNNQDVDHMNVHALWKAMNNGRDDQLYDNIGVGKLVSQQETERKKNKKSVQNYQQSYLDELNQILLGPDNDAKKQWHQSHQAHRHRLHPNDLLGDSIYEKVNRSDENNLKKYSKIYVILNVDAVNTSKNQNRLTDLVSSLFNSASSSQKNRRGSKKDRRYKGFLVRDSYRKSNAGDGMDTDLDYKPKRSRARDSGRTPIPYIRHRGDIYEKDN